LSAYKSLPRSLSIRDVNELIDSLKGHMHDLRWSAIWLFDEVIRGLVTEGKIKPDVLMNIWVKEIDSYLCIISKNNVGYFSTDSDRALTDQAAWLFISSELENKLIAIKTLKNRINGIRRRIQQPLASTVNWKKWDSALRISMWVACFCKACEKLHPLIKDEMTEFKDLMELSIVLAFARPKREWINSDHLVEGRYFSYLENETL